MRSRSFIQRIPLWGKIIAGLLLLVLIAGIAISIYLNNLVNNRLKEMVLESSQGLYRLDYERIRINALTGNVTMTGVQLVPDTAVFQQLSRMHQAPRFLVGGKTQQLVIRNVRWLAFLTNRRLRLGKLVIDRPELSLTQYRLKKDTATRSVHIADLIARHVKDLNIGEFSLNDAIITYQVSDTAIKERKVNRVEHLSVGFNAVRLEGDEAKKTLAADDYFIRLKEYRHRTADSMYWIGIRDFDYNSRKKAAKLGAFYSSPRYGDAEFARRLGEQDGRYDFALENIVAEGFDVTAFVEQGEAMLEKITIGSGKVDIYLNRAFPPRGAQTNVVPSQQLRKVGFPFNIREIDVRQLDITYREFNPATSQTGTLAFHNNAVKAFNVTNQPEVISQNNLLRVTMNSRFMNIATVKGWFEFDLNSADGRFKAHADVAQMNAERLNSLLRPLAKLEARNGMVQQFRFDVWGTDRRAVADVKLVYNDLKISILGNEDEGLEKKGLKSLFANILIKNDNPKDGVLRTARQVAAVRNPSRSFFNLLWTPVSFGIQEIVTGKKGFRFQ